MASKLVNIIALATLAVLASYGPSQASALSVDSHHFVRHNAAHNVLARRAEATKSTSRRRCKARPSSSLVAPSSSAPAPSTTARAPQQNNPSPTPAPSSTKAPAPPAPSPSQNTGNNNNNNNGGTNGGNTGGSSNGSRKVGIAWNNPNENHLANFIVSPKCGGVYTWSPWKPNILNQYNIPFFAMIWSDKHTADAKRLITGHAYTTTILGPNEPDEPSQANMSPQAAVDFWWRVMQPYASQGYKLISPAPTNGNRGLNWLKDFMNRCSGCTINGVAAHWYGTDAQNFIDHVTNYHNTFGRKVWVTEFACQNFGGGAQCSNDQIWTFMRTATNWMDGYAGVEMYFAFGVLHDMYNVNQGNQLMQSDGRPTPLGHEYLS